MAAFFYEQKLITIVHNQLITKTIQTIDPLIYFCYFYKRNDIIISR